MENQVATKPVVQKDSVSSSMAVSSVPTLVKVIAVLYYIGAAFAVLAAIAMFIGSSFIPIDLPEFLSGLVIVAGILFLAFAVLGFFLGRGLWKGQNWARIVVIIFAVIGVISGIITLIGGDFSSIIGLVINGLIGWYLIFNANVKQAFGK